MKHILLIAGLLSLGACEITPMDRSQLELTVQERMKRDGGDNTGGTYCPVEKARAKLC